MPFLIGTDEAGYGPNLGPLVIGATVWHVPTELHDRDLFAELAGVVSKSAGGCGAIPIADSKQLYHPGGGLCDLELGVLAALQTLGQPVTRWRHALIDLAPTCASTFDELPWHRDFDERVPLEQADDWSVRQASFADGLTRTNVRLIALQADAIFPRTFNTLVDQHGNKSNVLSRRTLELVVRLLDLARGEPVIVQCDKHGGRNHYVPVLQPLFPEFLVEVVREGRDASIYRWGPPSRRIEFRFTAKGESFLPAALASMLAKYLRELAMRAFNHFWQQQIPGLKPTAGYPLDARRFRSAIAVRQSELGIPDDYLWRMR